MGISNVSNGLRSGVCTSSTRPTAPYEGQMIYETDTDMMAIWNGTAWRYTAATTPTNGTVLQTVTATTSTVVTESSGTWTDSALSASITPKSSSSKVLVIVSQSMYNYAAGGSYIAMDIRLLRGATSLHVTADAGFARTGASTGTDIVHQYSINYLDSPATTSSVTYKTQIAKKHASSSVYSQINGNPGSMTLMEIA